jgi:hypothetical protein
MIYSASELSSFLKELCKAIILILKEKKGRKPNSESVDVFTIQTKAGQAHYPRNRTSLVISVLVGP